MADAEPTQETPKGVTIPVPSRADVMRDLKKVAKDARVGSTNTPDK